MGRKMPDNLLEEFSRFVEVNMGLNFPKEKWADLEKGLHAVCEQFGFDDEEVFARYVMSPALSKRQIEILASGLTVGETYFFREKKAFDAFAMMLKTLLPDLRDWSITILAQSGKRLIFNPLRLAGEGKNTERKGAETGGNGGIKEGCLS